MTQPSRVIYLPPGVTPQPVAHPPAGVPFDRPFFEQVLPHTIKSFCEQAPCEVPVVELYTIDGAVLYVNAISGLSDTWVALQTARPEHDHPVEVFIPYGTIFRVELHPAEDTARRRLGFLPPEHDQPPEEAQPGA